MNRKRRYYALLSNERPGADVPSIITDNFAWYTGRRHEQYVPMSFATHPMRDEAVTIARTRYKNLLYVAKRKWFDKPDTQRADKHFFETIDEFIAYMEEQQGDM